MGTLLQCRFCGATDEVAKVDDSTQEAFPHHPVCTEMRIVAVVDDQIDHMCDYNFWPARELCWRVSAGRRLSKKLVRELRQAGPDYYDYVGRALLVGG